MLAIAEAMRPRLASSGRTETIGPIYNHFCDRLIPTASPQADGCLETIEAFHKTEIVRISSSFLKHESL